MKITSPYSTANSDIFHKNRKMSVKSIFNKLSKMYFEIINLRQQLKFHKDLVKSLQEEETEKSEVNYEKMLKRVMQDWYYREGCCGIGEYDRQLNDKEKAALNVIFEEISNPEVSKKFEEEKTNYWDFINER